MRVDWRKLMPPRSGWLRLAAAPTSVALIAGLAMTLQGKARILRGIDDVSAWPVWTVWAASMDAFVYMGLAAMFAVAEGRTPWMRAATYPLALLVASVALINAWYLSVTGEQLTWEAIQLGFDRFTDLWRIAGEAVRANPGLSIAIGLAIVGVPVAARLVLHRRVGPWRRGHHDRERAHCAAAVAAVGLVVSLLWPAPGSLPAARLDGNAALGTYWGWLTDEGDDTVAVDVFEGYRVPRIVDAAEIATLRARTDRPNVLLVILESTRFDHTSLAPPARRRGTETPNLAALAAAGTSALRARPVLPHTTKSVFALLCGRYPTMQLGIIEHSANLEVQCVPEILADAGYRTALFQSAWGNFEHRVRLADRLGYRHFEGWEDIQGEMVGYLASDDLSLAEPVARWLDAGGEQPFFATVLTSAAHHPYRLPAGIPADGATTDEQRYARIVEGADALLGQLLAALEQRGVRDDTIVIVLGDHGEGFGAKGVRQHDNNYYEEGLHVPLVLQGPGVPVREIPQNVTLADVAPTLLGLLGVAIRPEAVPDLVGIDLLAGEVPERRLLFSCWYELRCRGFVQGDDKVVFVPHTGRGYYFDLAADPNEHDPKPIPAELRELIPLLNAELDGYRTRRWPIVYGETRFGDWYCAAGKECQHPNKRDFVMGGE